MKTARGSVIYCNVFNPVQELMKNGTLRNGMSYSAQYGSAHPPVVGVELSVRLFCLTLDIKSHVG